LNVHEMKISAKWFGDLARGAKSFEIRKDDRGGFAPGDILILREVDYNDNDVIYYTGRIITVKVTYVLTSSQFPDGIRKGYAVLGLGKPAVME